MEEQELDLLLVSNLVNVRYLTGFTGTNGAVLIGPARRVFLTDFRYVERAQREISDYDVVRGRDDLLEQVAELVARLGRGPGRLRRRPPDRARAREACRPLDRRRRAGAGRADSSSGCGRSRTTTRSRRSARAAELADEVYRWLISDFGLAGHTEREVARRDGAASARSSAPTRLSFPPIVAAADNGALPHAEPRADVQIPRDTLVVVDFGCVTDSLLLGLHPDVRDRRHRCGGARVLRAGALRAGRRARGGARRTPSVRAVDAVAREPIDAAGRGEQFGHGLGHGVGLEVHEAPRLAPTAEGTLAAGNVVTVEPGVYVPGPLRRADRGPGGRRADGPRGADLDPEGPDRRLSPAPGRTSCKRAVT